MKIIAKTLLLTIILIFFPLKSFAHVEHYEKVEKFLMEIFKDGKKIGFNNYTSVSYTHLTLPTIYSV